MNNENLETKVTILPPFKRFCMTIGELPTSYVESMSYYESLVWLCNYLSKTVIPAINTNGEAVTELQEKYIELKDYVDNYFDNLDVQTEIDNKLDDMAESGELAEIIAAYLEVASILGFDTKVDLKAADNLIEGSFARTLGTTSYNDGKGNFYKIRALEESDVIDDDNLLALSEYPSLVAEKMPDYRMNSVENNISTINTNITSLNTDISNLKKPQYYKQRKYLLVGDSYATGYQGSGVPTIQDYYTKVVNTLGITAQIVAGNGYGFVGIGGELKWVDLINSTTINNKDTFTDIIICGGMNDKTTEANLDSAMSELFSYLHTNFVNAEIHVGFVGRYAASSSSNIENNRKIQKSYQTNTIKYGNKYIYNSELLLHNYSWFISDKIHPNTKGQSQLAFGIEQYIVNNSIDQLMDITDNTDYQEDTFTGESGITLTGHLYSYLSPNQLTFMFQGQFMFDDYIACNNNGDIILGTLTNSYVCGAANQQGINAVVEGYVHSSTPLNGSNTIKVLFRLYNDYDNKLHVSPFTVRDDGGYTNYTINEINFPYGAIKCIADPRYC